MTGIDPERLERRLRWAAEQLGLSPNASADEVRAAWLRCLPEEDFVPSSELRWALAALLRRQSEGGWEARADEAASVAEEERLRGEVEAFAEKFWELPIDDRRRCWQELMDRCTFAPLLRARLKLLEAGLAVDLRQPSGDARVIELADHVHELFVLRPEPRARARQDILRRMRDEKKKWKTAARRLRRLYPALASLGNDLLKSIASLKHWHPRKKLSWLSMKVTYWRHKWGCHLLVIVVSVVAILSSLSAVIVNENSRPSSVPPATPLPWQLKHNPNIPPKPKGLRFDPQDLKDEKLRKILMGQEQQKKPVEGRKKTDGKSP